MLYELNVVTPPVESPVSLVEAKAHLRVEQGDDDALIQGLIEAATTLAEEGYLWRAIVTRTLRVRLMLTAADGVIWLPFPPVQAVASVTLQNPEVALAPEQYSVRQALGVVVLKDAPARGRECVIEYTAGYGDASVTPRQYKAAILLMVGNWYENREAVVLATQPAEMPLGVGRLLSPWRAERPG